MKKFIVPIIGFIIIVAGLGFLYVKQHQDSKAEGREASQTAQSSGNPAQPVSAPSYQDPYANLSIPATANK